MDAMESSDYLSQNQQPRVYAQTLIVFPLAIVATLLRFASRHKAKAGFWWDDWLLLAGSILNCGQTAITFIVLHYGLGKHIETMAPSDMPGFVATYYAGQLIYAAILVCIKASILTLYWRIWAHVPWCRYPIYALGVLTVLWFLMTFFGCVFACTPVSLGWGDMSDPNGYCINKKAFFLVVAAVNSFTDFSILAVPMIFVSKLQTRNMSKKILIGATFLLGGFVCVATLVRISVLATTNFSDPDQSWLQTSFAIWTGVEINLAIISACLPILRPLFASRDSDTLPSDERRYSSNDQRSPTTPTTVVEVGRSNDSLFDGNLKRSMDARGSTPLELHEFWMEHAIGSRTQRDRIEMPSPASEEPSSTVRTEEV